MSDEMREAFEKWYAQKYLGVNVGDAFEYLPSHGYKRLDVHFPWLGYQAATAAADAKYLPVIEKLVEALKNAPVHVTKDGVWLNFRCDHEAKIGTAMVKVEGFEALAVANWGDKSNQALTLAAPLLGRK